MWGVRGRERKRERERERERRISSPRERLPQRDTSKWFTTKGREGRERREREGIKGRGRDT